MTTTKVGPTKCKIVWAQTGKQLAEEVNKYLDKGWYPDGSIMNLLGGENNDKPGYIQYLTRTDASD